MSNNRKINVIVEMVWNNESSEIVFSPKQDVLCVCVGEEKNHILTIFQCSFSTFWDQIYYVKGKYTIFNTLIQVIYSKK